MLLPRIARAQQLRDLCAAQPVSPCDCPLKRCTGWDSLGGADWNEAQLPAVATVRDVEVLEPTFEEFHPNGTRYESADAPVSIKHFPTNRCDVHRCLRCGQHVLRYTEYGGYYVDPRGRRLNPGLIVDDAAA
jgi:hypothetical protein